MSSKPAYIILASSGGKLLGSFGPYRSEKRAAHVRRALHLATLGSPSAVQVERLALEPGVLTPGKAVEFLGPLVWGDAWQTDSSTSGEWTRLPEPKEEEA